MTHYCIVRQDLPIGVLAAQLVHAAGESSTGDLKEGTYAVVLAASNELELKSIRKLLFARGVDHVAIHEPDPPYHGQLMAIGVVPKKKSQVYPHLSSIPLLRNAGVAQSVEPRCPAVDALSATCASG